jgi:hypothetical protein
MALVHYQTFLDMEYYGYDDPTFRAKHNIPDNGLISLAKDDEVTINFLKFAMNDDRQQSIRILSNDAQARFNAIWLRVMRRAERQIADRQRVFKDAASRLSKVAYRTFPVYWTNSSEYKAHQAKIDAANSEHSKEQQALYEQFNTRKSEIWGDFEGDQKKQYQDVHSHLTNNMNDFGKDVDFDGLDYKAFMALVDTYYGHQDHYEQIRRPPEKWYFQRKAELEALEKSDDLLNSIQRTRALLKKDTEQKIAALQEEGKRIEAQWRIDTAAREKKLEGFITRYQKTIKVDPVQDWEIKMAELLIDLFHNPNHTPTSDDFFKMDPWEYEAEEA